ncbi:MAG: PLDc N-terminal domain-containing protein [Firmicutes bacterium]|nr:PLDc N-terminal domain-containing protein [Bacillota bacterium]
MYHFVWIIVALLDIFAIISLLLGHGSAGHKILWILLIIILPVLGMILYYIFGRKRVDAGTA